MLRCLTFLLILSFWAQPSLVCAQVEPQSPAGKAKAPKERAHQENQEDQGKQDAATAGPETKSEPDDSYEGETPSDAELEPRTTTVKESIKEDKQKGGLLKADTAETDAEGLAELEASSLAEPSTVSLSDVETVVPEDVKLPGRLGPVRLYIGDTEDWLRIGLVAQLEYEHEQLLRQERGSLNTLEFRRIRTILGSSFLEGRIRTQLQLNLSPQALELIDLWLGFTRFRFASVRAGQFKIPFTRYRSQSNTALSFADWSPVTRMFGAERQFGLEVLASGGLGNLEYALGLFTGQNARASHAVGLEEYYGEQPSNPSALGDGFSFTQFDPALIGRVAKNIGKINTDTNTDLVGGPLRHSLGFSIAWTARADVTVDLPVRLAFEWLGKVNHFDFNAIAYLGWFERWTNENLAYGSFGLLAEMGYRFTHIFELATRYSLVYYSNALQNDAKAYAAEKIANADDPDMAASQYAGVGELIANHELSLAAGARIIGNSLKTLVEFDWIPYKLDEGRQNALAVTLQLQFMF